MTKDARRSAQGHRAICLIGFDRDSVVWLQSVCESSEMVCETDAAREFVYLAWRLFVKMGGKQKLARIENEKQREVTEMQVNTLAAWRNRLREKMAGPMTPKERIITEAQVRGCDSLIDELNEEIRVWDDQHRH